MTIRITGRSRFGTSLDTRRSRSSRLCFGTRLLLCTALRRPARFKIEGNGHTISGDSRFPIFIVDEGNLTIRDLTLADGNARGRAGGAIRLGYKSVLEASHVAFVNNSGRLGGAIASGSRSELRVAHSSFRGNRAWSNGGAIHVGGQATISHSVLNGNSAAYEGGAIHSLWNLELDNSTLTQNRADEGGALWVARATLTQVTIANNAATQAGGIAMLSGVTLRNSIVAGNLGGDCAVLNEPVAVANSLIGDGSCDAELSGDPLLGDFSSDRGYYPLLPGSPAIDAADRPTRQSASGWRMRSRCT